MENENKVVSRKNFLGWGVGIASLLAVPSFLLSRKKKKETKTTKMLTQDGKLVEIDISSLPSQRKKIKPQDIHTWVTTKRSSL